VAGTLTGKPAADRAGAMVSRPAGPLLAFISPTESTP
jgi:hypothetical protein